MAKFHAEVKIRLRPSILDPKGKASLHALHNLGFNYVEQVRIGKIIDLTIESPTKQEAEAQARQSCEKLLANEVMEDFEISITELSTA